MCAVLIIDFILPKPKPDMTRLVFIILLLACSTLNAQTYVVSGIVSDASNGEEIIGATILVDSLTTGTVTNVYGHYSLQLPAGTHKLRYSTIGFATIELKVNLQADLRQDMELGMSSTLLDAVTITGEKEDAALDNVQMSVQKMDINEIRKIPAFMGEVDVIRAIQLMPGVQTMGEGSTGMYVRGGAADENLILLDEAPVYNAAHLLGIFSTFNSDAIKDVQLYKGGIPAAYGGRLSSVLDVRMKEGNQKQFAMRGGIGTVSSRLTLEAPIFKEKGSFMLSGRRTYVDVFTLLSKDQDVKDSKAYFYDLNAKANYRLNENNRFYLSGFFGRDVFGQSGDDGFGIDWGNTTGTLRWNHIYGSRLFSNLTVYYSDYDYSLGTDASTEAFSWTASVKNLSGKLDYHYTIGQNSQLRFGLQTIRYDMSPGVVKSESVESIITGLELESDKAYEHGIYVSHEYGITDDLTADYGLRFSAFQNIGQSTVLGYNDAYEVVDTTSYAKGEVFNTYSGLEPRLGLRYRINESTSIKASYNRMNQYIHLASNGSSVSPFDIYFPSSPTVKPRQLDQVGLGYFKNLKNNDYELSVELYYKEIRNSLDFKDHAQLFLNTELEGELRFGKGRAAGLEFLLRKNEGLVTGFVSYTLSGVRQTIDDVNGGREYRAKQDRLHDLAVVATWQINDRWNAGANFIWQSGRAITVPTGRLDYGGTVVPVYSDRNAARLPSYHRLDLSATLQQKKNNSRKWKGEWVFSVYNAYFKKNAFSLAFVNNEDGKPVARKTYLFPIIPSVTYNFTF